MVAALSGCGEDAKDCNGFWDKTFGREECVTQQFPVQNATLAKDVHFVKASNTQLVTATVISNETGHTLITVPNTTDMAKIPVGQVLMMEGGRNSHYPLGLTGRIVSVIQESNGQKTLEVKPVSLVEAFDKLDISYQTPITSDNIVKVFSPFDMNGQSVFTAKTVSNQSNRLLSKPKTEELSCKAEKSFVLFNDCFRKIKVAGEVVEDGGAPFKSNDRGFEFSVALPFYDADKKSDTDDDRVDLVLSFGIKDAIADANIKYDKSDLSDPLKSAKLKFTGVVNGAVKLKGKANLSIDKLMGDAAGSKVWEAFEEQAKDWGGLDLKIKGLSADDKRGKLPIAGLVIQPRPGAVGGFITPKVAVGNSSFKEVLDTASIGGGIIWVYLTQNLELEFEGEFGADIQNTSMEFGLDATSDGKGNINANPVNTITKSATATSSQLRIPFFNGSVKGTQTTGFNLDVDAFFMGIRPFTAQAFVGEKAFVKLAADAAYVNKFDGQGFTPTLKGCSSINVGFGAKFKVLLGIGADLKIDLPGFDREVSGEFAYSFYNPKREDAEKKGHQGLFWFNVGDEKDVEAEEFKACKGVPTLNPIFTYEQLPLQALGFDYVTDGKYYPVKFDVSKTEAVDGNAEDIKKWKFIIDGVEYPYTPTKDNKIFTFRFDRPDNHRVVLEIENEFHQKRRYEKELSLKVPVIVMPLSSKRAGDTVSFYVENLSDMVSEVGQQIKNVVWSIYNYANDSINDLVVEVTESFNKVIDYVFNSEGGYRIIAEVKDERNQLMAHIKSEISILPCDSIVCTPIFDNGLNDPTLENLYEVQKIGLDTSDGTLRLPLNVGEVDATFPYIWIANSGEGTISKLATRDHYRKNPQTGEQELVKTGQELGRYRTGPGNGNPSRTTVDQEGNVWVGNRDNNTITKVGLFEFGNCVDRNGNGKIDTSTGGTDIKDWSGYFGDGQGIANAQDECILQHVALSANGVNTPYDIRMIAIDKDNNLFVGGHQTSSIFKVNGRTGQIIKANNTNGSFYGGLVDKEGNLWAVSKYFHGSRGMVHKVSNDLSTSEIINPNVDAYGIALDKYGKIWVTSVSTLEFATFNPADITGTLRVFSQQGRNGGQCYAQGLAVDDNDNIFIAGAYYGCNSDSLVGHYKQTVNGSDTSVQFVANYRVSSGPTGVAVDGKGNVWSSDYGNNAVSRIVLADDPANAKIDTFPVGATPYNYSDMTGRTVRNITNRQGTWEAIFDGAIPDFEWKKLVWSLKNQLPEGTTVTAYVKTADKKVDLGNKEYKPVESNQTMTDMKGQFIKVKFTLTSANQESTPEITGIDLQ